MKRFHDHGFTLLEVVVAILIISALAMAFAPLIASSIERIRWAGKRTEELYALRSEMEVAMATKGSLLNTVQTQELNIKSLDGSYPPENKERKMEFIIVEVGGLVSLLPKN